MPAENHKGVFKQNELFSECPFEAIPYQTEGYKKGSRILSHIGGEPALFLILKGRVQVSTICADGTCLNLNTLEPGECFGISNIFSAEDMNTVLVCDTKTTVAYIRQSQFFKLLRDYPEMYKSYATLCNQKIRFLTEKIELLTMPTCRVRLASYFLKNQDEGKDVCIHESKERLAEKIGVSRASLYRELNYMTDNGIIIPNGKTYHINKEQALRQLVFEG